jgi:hypothetical protein
MLVVESRKYFPRGPHMARGPDVDRPCFSVWSDCTTVEGEGVCTKPYGITSRKTVSLRLTDTLSPTHWGRLGGVNATLQLFSTSLLCTWAVSIIHWSLNVSEQWTSWESHSGYVVEKFHVFHGTPLFTTSAYRSAFYIFTYLLTYLPTYLLTYLFHRAESFLRS